MRTTRLAVLLLPLLIPTGEVLAQGRTGGPIRAAPTEQAPAPTPAPARAFRRRAMRSAAARTSKRGTPAA